MVCWILCWPVMPVSVDAVAHSDCPFMGVVVGVAQNFQCSSAA
jgi:hypothetical protein